MLDFEEPSRPVIQPHGERSTFHGWGVPWWLAIVMLTIVVRTLLFPITYRQVRSMRRMQDLKPDMDRSDRVQRRRPEAAEEMAKLYQERQVNPLGGCLPIFIQLPHLPGLVLHDQALRHAGKLQDRRPPVVPEPDSLRSPLLPPRPLHADHDGLRS